MKSKLKVIILLVVSIIFSTSILFANELPFEKYKQGVMAFQNQDWVEAEQYFDEIILEDLSYSQYLAKSMYLKTLLLAAKIERDLELKNIFLAGEKALSFEDKEEKKALRDQANNYELAAKRKVDTLIGLSNYLLVNLPPLNMNITFTNNRWDYNPEWMDLIKSGQMISKEKVKILENGILAKKVNEYLDLTLGVDSFNNIFVVRAEQGDNLYYLSKQYKVPFSTSLRLNQHIQNPNLIYPNEKVYMPKRTNYIVDYPAYFYYISNISYIANKERKEDITRLVFRAYQLTSEKNNIPAPQDYAIFMEGIELKDYQEQVQTQNKELKAQYEKINEIEKKYNELMEELKEIKSNLGTKKIINNDSDILFENNNYQDYDPSKDPLTY